jgi:hypothetical protein
VTKLFGRPPGLTLEQITDAALADGIATSTMPSIARRLGVAHSGLYRYVNSNEEIRVMVWTRSPEGRPGRHQTSRGASNWVLHDQGAEKVMDLREQQRWDRELSGHSCEEEKLSR